MATQIPLLYEIEIGGGRHHARTVEGAEGLSRPFRFEITFYVDPHDPLDPDAVVGTEATLVLVHEAPHSALPEPPRRRISAVVSRAARVATRGGNHGTARVTVTLEPRFAWARFRVDIRIFREKTVPEIVEEVLSAHGVKVERRLTGSYVRRHYTVQMRESDLDFCARLLENEGIFYIVDDDGRFIMADHDSAYLEGPGELLFRHDQGLHGQRDAVYEVGWAGQATAGKVSLRDFNPDKPRLDMDVSATGPTAWGPEWYDYPGEYELPSLGQIKADLRAQALACQKRRLAGQSTCASLQTGGLFMLFDAPAGVDDGQYVVTKIDHRWVREGSSFTIGFEALHAKTVYRPPVVTEEPILPSPLTGFITGPAGSDIYTDTWGRVKVHFQWDRLQPKDENCSYWIPVLQDNTGQSSAMPRIGWEVLCQYLEGDPDRPVILGRVFNVADPFTEELPKRKMRTTLQSMTSPRSEWGDTGFNMIRLDDLAGAEQIELHAQRDQFINVAKDQTENIGNVEDRVVKGNETMTVSGNETVDVKTDDADKVDSNQKVTVKGNRTIKVKGHNIDTVQKDHQLKIGGDHEIDVHDDSNLAVMKNLTETITGSVTEKAKKTIIVAAGEKAILDVTGSIMELAKMGKAEGTEQDRKETVKGSCVSMAGKEHAARAEESRTTTVDGAFDVVALDEILIAGVEKLKGTAKDITLIAPSVTLKVGDTTIHLKSGRIDMNAPQTITYDTQGNDNLGATQSSQN